VTGASTALDRVNAQKKKISCDHGNRVVLCPASSSGSVFTVEDELVDTAGAVSFFNL
jgi:hypothetical protein